MMENFLFIKLQNIWKEYDKKLSENTRLNKEILRHIIAEAEARSYLRISLETGTNDAFLPARTLYERSGFRQCAPFGDYEYDPYSTYYEKELAVID